MLGEYFVVCSILLGPPLSAHLHASIHVSLLSHSSHTQMCMSIYVYMYMYICMKISPAILASTQLLFRTDSPPSYHKISTHIHIYMRMHTRLAQQPRILLSICLTLHHHHGSRVLIMDPGPMIEDLASWIQEPGSRILDSRS